MKAWLSTSKRAVFGIDVAKSEAVASIGGDDGESLVVFNVMQSTELPAVRNRDGASPARVAGGGGSWPTESGPGQSAGGAISVTEDTFVVAIARGRRPLEPVLTGDPGKILPFAMTAPLWIDADGDGRSLGRAAAP